MMRRWTAGYGRLLRERPLATKAVTSCVLVAAGDAITQVALEDRFQWRRAANMAVIGGLVVGPSLHAWYGLLGTRIAAKGLRGAVMRLAIDQTVFAPVFIGVFFTALHTLDGTLHELPAVLRNNYKTTLVANWKLWVPANLINFAVVPPPFQVLFANAVGLVWNCYLSYVGHRDTVFTLDGDLEGAEKEQ